MYLESLPKEGMKYTLTIFIYLLIVSLVVMVVLQFLYCMPHLTEAQLIGSVVMMTT